MSFPYYQDFSGKNFPVLPLRLNYKEKITDTFALIDSGATISIFKADIAKKLEVDIETGKEIILGGVGGRIKGYVHKVKMEVAEKILIIPVVFSHEYLVSFNLLGREIFFENFQITFDERNLKLKLG